jgi:thymidine kinase
MPKLSPKLEVNCGGMFSGKSTELQRQGKRHMLAGHKVIFIKPQMDDRYSDTKVVTHDGLEMEAVNAPLDAILTAQVYGADVVLIDEVQFFEWGIVQDIDYLVKAGKVVYCSGLDMDFTGTPFHITAHLMAVADEVNKFKAVCSICGDDSYVTAKTSGSNVRVELGSQDKYKPVCRPCFNKLEEEK